MKRRALLTSMVALAGGIAGCSASRSDEVALSTTDAPTTNTVRPSKAHTVRVETIRTSPMTGREVRVVASPEGDLSVIHSCDGESNERSKPLSADAHDALVRTVLAADLASMADTYECPGDCPMDVPGKRYVLTVDGAETTVYIEAQADDVPDGLVEIQRQLDTLQKGLETPSCGTPAG